MAVLQLETAIKPGNAVPLLRRGHWSTDGLIGAWLFNEGGGSQYYDLTRDPRQIGTATSSTLLTRRVNKLGRGIDISSTGGHYVEIAGVSEETPAYLAGLNAYSFVWAGVLTASSGFRGVFETGNWATLDGAGGFFVSTGDSLEHWVNSLSRASSGLNFLTVNSYATYAMTRNAGEYRFFRDGQFHSNDSSGFTDSVVYNAANDDVCILGAGSPDQYPYAGQHDFFWLYNRPLSDGEARALTANPLVILEPKSFYFFPSAGGGETIIADSGSYAYTGYDVTLTKTGAATLVADSGSYAYTGNEADLLIDRYMTADAGSYAYTGYDANFSTAKGIIADSGSYAYTGYDVTLTAPNKVMAESGSYGYTGYDVALTSTAQRRWKDLEGEPAGPWMDL